MAEYNLELDDNHLAASAKYLGTEAPEETVNAALREIASWAVRRKAWEEMAALGDAGQFDELLQKKDPR